MSKTLLVGATGQLGTATVRKLISQGMAVRAMVRSVEGARRMQQLGAETCTGDLTQPSTLASCCKGVDTVVTTANAAIPTRRTDTFTAVERDGYRFLIRAATRAGVSRFIYTSAPVSGYRRLSPLLKYKHETENLLVESGLEYLIFRADIFMDTAFAMMGSPLPIRGAEAATVMRPFQFSADHFDRIRDSIETKHVALVPGDGKSRHHFIAVDDVASFLLAAAAGGPPGVHTIGGPEALGFLEVVRIYEQILGISLKARHMPAWLLRAAIPVLRPFSPAGSNIMGLNYIAAKEETLTDPAPAASLFGVTLTSAETFLRSKLKAGAVAG